jgi:hypothetical protein
VLISQQSVFSLGLEITVVHELESFVGFIESTPSALESMINRSVRLGDLEKGVSFISVDAVSWRYHHRSQAPRLLLSEQAYDHQNQSCRRLHPRIMHRLGKDRFILNFIGLSESDIDTLTVYHRYKSHQARCYWQTQSQDYVVLSSPRVVKQDVISC